VKAIPLGAGSYNVEPSADGSIVIVTNKKDQASASGHENVCRAGAREDDRRSCTASPTSPDGRYAYIAQESIGADPGQKSTSST
jgi:hypothetical protein